MAAAPPAQKRGGRSVFLPPLEFRRKVKEGGARLCPAPPGLGYSSIQQAYSHPNCTKSSKILVIFCKNFRGQAPRPGIHWTPALTPIHDQSSIMLNIHCLILPPACRKSPGKCGQFQNFRNLLGDTNTCPLLSNTISISEITRRACIAR